MNETTFKSRRPKIVVVAGNARSGKTKLAKILKHFFELKNKKVVVCEFSRYLKIFAKDVLGSCPKGEKKPRTFLQQLGVELIKQKLGKTNFVINRQIEDIEVYSYFFDVIIISDARFVEEIDAIKQKFENVCAIRVISNKSNNLTTKQKAHATEQALLNVSNSTFDFVVENNFGNKTFKNDIEILFNKLTTSL